MEDFGDTNFDELERDLREANLFDADEVVDFVISSAEDFECESGKRMFKFQLRAINHPTRSSAFLPRENALLPYRNDNGKMAVVGNILNILKAIGIDAKGKSLSEVFSDPSVYVGMEGALRIGVRSAKVDDYAVEHSYLEEGENYNFIKKYLKK